MPRSVPTYLLKKGKQDTDIKLQSRHDSQKMNLPHASQNWHLIRIHAFDMHDGFP
jgi:hypothetical protein